MASVTQWRGLGPHLSSMSFPTHLNQPTFRPRATAMSLRSQSKSCNSALTGICNYSPQRPHLDLRSVQIFKHRPLPDPNTHLRHLYLRPKKWNTTVNDEIVVRCELLPRPMKDVDPYVALSYTWRDPRLRRSVMIGEKVYNVTENLAIALEHLQEEKTLILWIDAICIDQSNEHEKSIQVQRMGEIFSSAAFVIAWIGTAADESDLALQELKRCYLNRAFSLEPNVFANQFFATLPIEPTRALFSRPWFKRVWVGQEVALSTDVFFICGQQEICRIALVWAYLCFVRFRYIWEAPFWEVPCHIRFHQVERLPLRDFLG
jgi:hypothetical protein